MKKKQKAEELKARAYLDEVRRKERAAHQELDEASRDLRALLLLLKQDIREPHLG